mgnify:CR=1 FL=1
MRTVVVTDVERADPSSIDALGVHGVATVHEAMGRSGLVGASLRPIQDGVRIAGSAVTALGDARHHGPDGPLRLNEPVVGLAPAALWLTEAAAAAQAYITAAGSAGRPAGICMKRRKCRCSRMSMTSSARASPTRKPRTSSAPSRPR